MIRSSEASLSSLRILALEVVGIEKGTEDVLGLIPFVLIH